jgi:hypothetical protein
MLNGFEVGGVMIDRFVAAGGHFRRSEVELPRGTLAVYNPRDDTIKLRPDDVDPDGSLSDLPRRDFVATLTHEFWHAYRDQVVQEGWDPTTAAVMARTADWLKQQQLSNGDGRITGSKLGDPAEFVDEYIGALINELVGRGTGIVAIRQAREKGEITAAEAQQRWERNLRNVREADDREAYEDSEAPVYVVHARAPEFLIDHLLLLLDLRLPGAGPVWVPTVLTSPTPLPTTPTPAPTTVPSREPTQIPPPIFASQIEASLMVPVTRYSVDAGSSLGLTLQFDWELEPAEKSCNNFGGVGPVAIWAHGNDQPCSHTTPEHAGTIRVVISDNRGNSVTREYTGGSLSTPLR